MRKTITVDTNLLIDDEKIIFKLIKEYDKILIPVTVLKELDKHKYNPNLSFSARNAIRSINEFRKEYPEKIIFYISDDDIESNDQKILRATKENKADLATKDISMSIIAEAQGIEAKVYDIVMNNLFDPYNYVTIEQIYKSEEHFEFDRFYQNIEYEFILLSFSKILGKILDKNSWFFIFIQTEKQEPYIYANNPIKRYLTRVDHHKHYRELKCDNGKVIKARDIFQVCAIYALKEAPHVLITGKWGSGKSLLASAYALEKDSEKKAFISRPPIGINGKYNIGFVPGDKEEKMIEWLAGFTSSLYYIYGNTNGQTDGKNSYNFVKDTIFNSKFEVLPLNSIQGLSLLDDDLLLIDEIQLISVDYMSMILSRPSENGKLIMIGDLKQTYDVVKPSESGLLKLLRILPHRSMAYVKLEQSYRSDVLELADMLQDKTMG